MTTTDPHADMRIDILPHGPYRVSGGVPLVIVSIVRNEQKEAVGWKQMDVLPQKDTYMLCRCGASKNKPYCDGTHVAIGFDGTEVASKEPFNQAAERIQGSDIVLYDQVNLCIGAEFCDRFGGIWNLTQLSPKDSELVGSKSSARDCSAGACGCHQAGTALSIWQARHARNGHRRNRQGSRSRIRSA